MDLCVYKIFNKIKITYKNIFKLKVIYSYKVEANRTINYLYYIINTFLISTIR